MSDELVVTRSALIEVGFDYIAAHVEEFLHPNADYGYPVFTDGTYGFDSRLEPDEFLAVRQAFMLGHQVHDRSAHLCSDGGIHCPLCSALEELDEDGCILG